MWKRLQLKYDFINGSICNNSINGYNSSDDDEDDEFSILDANSSKKCQSKKSDKSSNQQIQNSIEELRIHFICNEKKQERYLKSLLKYCKEPQDNNYRLSKKYSNYFDRRVARIKEKNFNSNNNSNNTSNNSNNNNNSNNGNNEYEIQCLVGSSERPNCSCKFILIDLSCDQLNNLNNLNEKELINNYLKNDLDCGETIKEYLNTINGSNENNLSIVIVGLSYERKNKINPNMIKLCKALSNEYSLPYIEIDIGKRNQRRNLLYFYSVYCHSKKMTSHQLTFLKTNNTNDEWLL
ncbi:predicted protein [Naegleria gruberi]|uniref:Predicted protein n=1 Tax=Naegleria gruberi TaxID=5762 RepID=D2VID4_NAEGR|nr:uncharacterized protein NAEGRDRAFT_68647 [Naegleria gruberi]EFC43492.1 predicted protein [Naegleria gruberi]|eukprot:XP_002676236.1 predicted protein [Naegleria gruberi strain NEG-M]